VEPKRPSKRTPAIEMAGTQLLGRHSRWHQASRALCASILLAGRLSGASECPPGDPLVLVDTATHRLRLCENGVAVRVFRVALGRGGTGKRKEGDNRTPLGVYPLGMPQPSSRFGTFIPVGYPTQEQAAAGLTGTDIGIHGPDQQFAFLGRATVSADWTAGCVAVGSDAAIQAIAEWVLAKHVGSIELK